MLIFAEAAGVGSSTGSDARLPVDGTWELDGKVLRWTDYPYNLIVRLSSQIGTCTGQYVARDLILTAAHCVKKGQQHTVKTADGREFPVGLEAMGFWDDSFNNVLLVQQKDWALFRITNPKGFLPEGVQPLDVEPKSPLFETVWNAGFGGMRRVDDDEIDEIKQIIVSTLKAQGQKFIFATTVHIADKETDVYKAITAAFQPPKQPLWGDSGRLKLTPYCKTKAAYGHPNLIYHNCDAVGGNSGSALILDKDGGRYSVVGVISGGHTTVGKNILNEKVGIGEKATKTELFYDKYLEAKASSPAPSQQQSQKTQPAPQPAPQPSQQPQMKSQYCLDCAALNWVGTEYCPAGANTIFSNKGKLYRMMSGNNASWAYKYALAAAVDDSFCQNVESPQAQAGGANCDKKTVFTSLVCKKLSELFQQTQGAKKKLSDFFHQSQESKKKNEKGGKN